MIPMHNTRGVFLINFRYIRWRKYLEKISRENRRENSRRRRRRRRPLSLIIFIPVTLLLFRDTIRPLNRNKFSRWYEHNNAIDVNRARRQNAFKNCFSSNTATCARVSYRYTYIKAKTRRFNAYAWSCVIDLSCCIQRIIDTHRCR